MSPGHGRPSQRRPLALGLATLCLVGGSGDGLAQEVRGRAVADDGGEGIATALVEMFDENGDRVGAVVTGDEGRFRLELSRTGGPFVLDVWALGYRRATLDSLFVYPSRPLDLGEIRLETSPIGLDTLRVQARRRGLVPGRELVRRRQLLGRGTFLSGAVLEADDPESLVQYLADASGLVVLSYPTLHSPDAWGGCMEVHINHWPGLMGYGNIDHIPLEHIAAVEIYSSPDDIPKEKLINLDTAFNGCGLVNIWLWNSW